MPQEHMLGCLCSLLQADTPVPVHRSLSDSHSVTPRMPSQSSSEHLTYHELSNFPCLPRDQSVEPQRQGGRETPVSGVRDTPQDTNDRHSYIDPSEHRRSSVTADLATQTGRSVGDRPFSTSVPQRSHKTSARSEPPIYELQDLLPPRRTLPFGKTKSPKASIYSDDLEPLPKPNFLGEPKVGRSDSGHTGRSQQVSKDESTTEWQKKIVNQHVERMPKGMPPPPEVFRLPKSATKHTPQGRFPDISIYEDENDRQISDQRSSNLMMPSPSAVQSTSPYHSTMGSPPRPSTAESSDQTAPSSVTFGGSSSPLALMEQSPNREIPRTSVSDPVLDGILDEVERIMTNPRFGPIDGSDRQELAAYARQSRTQRMDALDSMMCEYLQDENFRTLCVDVESAWRLRIVSEQAGSRQ